MALVRKRDKKKAAESATQAPNLTTEPSQEDSGTPEAADHRHNGRLHAAGKDESPESHPHKFDGFGNPQ